MTREACDLLTRQFETAWALTDLHLQGLTTEECLWRPAREGPHVRPAPGGGWHADWPDHEGYDLGPASIAWLTWHLGFWWSMALDHSIGNRSLSRETILWPGSADGVRDWAGGLRSRWRSMLDRITDDELRSRRRAGWPLDDCRFGDFLAWANVELMKNAAEIGYARFLYAQRDRGE